MMNDVELHAHCWSLVKAIPAPLVARAVEVIREKLSANVMAELRERIEENPTGWLGGRASVACSMCRGTGIMQELRPEVKVGLNANVYDYAAWDEARSNPANTYGVTCAICSGTCTAPEGGLHFGFGMATRNMLRSNGCGEKFLGIDNLDDHYSCFLELAAGFSAP